MEQDDRDRVLQNLDVRLGRVEQLLPTLGTREETHGAIQEAVAPLATREETHGAIQEAVAPLATREEMHAAIQEAVAPLATREEMHAAIQEAVAPLATREDLVPLATRVEMYAAIKADGEQTRHHTGILIESLRDDIRIVAEGQAALWQRMSATETRHDGITTALDTRVTALEVWRRSCSQ